MDMALEHLDVAIRCHDEHEATAFFHRGRCRMVLGDMGGASADFGRVAALDPQVGRLVVLCWMIDFAVSSPLLHGVRRDVQDCTE
eukprot:751089-Hanusia_phi.AAC.5